GELARLPHRAGRGVLEQDALLAQALANRIRLAEVLAAARLVARGDRRLDVRRTEPGALLAPAPRRLEERRWHLGEEPRGGGDGGELAPDSGRCKAITGIEQAIQLAYTVEHETERAGRV